MVQSSSTQLTDQSNISQNLVTYLNDFSWCLLDWLICLSWFQVGQQNLCCYSRGRYFLPGGILIICCSHFNRNRWLRTHLNSEQKNSRILWNSPSWSEAIPAPLHNTRGVENPLWSTMGSFCPKKIYLWPIGNTRSWPTNISKGHTFLLTPAYIYCLKKRGLTTCREDALATKAVNQ